MEVKASLNYLRIAPRKVRLVADLIRGKKVEEAQNILNFIVKKANQPLIKLLRSAVANAKNNFQLDESNLYISKLTVDEGPKLKRWRPRARGSAAEIQKKTSHITLVLDEIEKKLKKVKRVKKIAKVKEVSRIEKEKPKIEEPPKESKSPTGQAKFRPGVEAQKPKMERGIKRIFRRKAF